jgi:branched-chain amino acid transport system permease protein
MLKKIIANFCKPRHCKIITATLSGLVLLALPFITDYALGRIWVRILDFSLLYILLALGLNIVVGFAGLLDLGFVAFFAVGAYSYAILASPHLNIHLPTWLLLPISTILAGFFGILLGTPTLKLRGDYLAIVTLGFGEIVRIFLNNLNAPYNLTGGPQGINLIDPLSIGSFSLNQTVWFPAVYNYYYCFLGFALLIVFITHRLQYSRIGRAWVAIREDEIAAQAMGINTRNIKLLAFSMGASFGGLGGGLFAGFQGFVSPESFNLMESIMILCMIVLGGMGHIPGVIFGAILLTVLPEALRYLGPLQNMVFGKVLADPADLRMLVFGLALILVMLLRPTGLWPSPVRKNEFDNHKHIDG